MSYKTLASRWMKKRELIVLGIAVAFIVHYAGLPSMLVTHFGSVPFSGLILGSGLSAVVYSLLERKRTGKTM